MARPDNHGIPSAHEEPHLSGRSGWLRAAVMGANDGILSTASLIMGVAAGAGDHVTIMLAGAAGMAAGALSMAAGEYVSVSSQEDVEQADIRKEKAELKRNPAGELDELTAIYETRGLPPELAREVAEQLTEADALGAHLRDELSLAGIAAQPIDWLPEGLRCQGRPSVQALGAFKQGHFEVQDAGSQLLARLCAPQRGQTVVDFCAGAGGKTLALGALMRNSGRIYALDTSSSRLARLKPRLARSGLSNVWAIAIQGLNDLRIKRLRAKADIVLVDAPCTGLGTLRRNPDLKWRQTSQGLGDLLSLQASILSAASTLVKPGGRLVYATCSLKREENEEQVETFLKAYPEFSMDSAERILLRQGISPGPQASWFGEQGELRLWPHRSDTDGFFGVNLVRA